jgi:uncharacterized protein
MHNIKDEEYLQIVANILDNKSFMRLEKIVHHNTNRFDHSIKVSYNAYKVARFLKLDFEQVARAGLLHDFYLERTTEYKKVKDKVKLFTIQHPQDAIDNSLKHFNLTNKEIDIIRTHMFPLDFHIPRYLESWVVNMTDSCISIYEFSHKFKHQISYATNLYVLFLINLVR